MSLPRKRCFDLQNKYICRWHSHRKLPSNCFCCQNSLIFFCWCMQVWFLLCTCKKPILHDFETLVREYLGKLLWNKTNFHFIDLTLFCFWLIDFVRMYCCQLCDQHIYNCKSCQNTNIHNNLKVFKLCKLQNLYSLESLVIEEEIPILNTQITLDNKRTVLSIY